MLPSPYPGFQKKKQKDEKDDKISFIENTSFIAGL